MGILSVSRAAPPVSSIAVTNGRVFSVPFTSVHWLAPFLRGPEFDMIYPCRKA